jgi:ankyrin repeat protein
MVAVKRISSALISFLIAGIASGISLASAGSPNAESKTPLMLAAESGYSQKVHALLERGADANARTAENGTALMFSAYGGYIDIVRTLLDAGASIDASDASGLTALVYASGAAQAGTTRLLLERGANPNVMFLTTWTPLAKAAEDGQFEIVMLLLEHGAITEPRLAESDRPASIPVVLAAMSGHTDIVDALLDSGADINAADNKKMTALGASLNAPYPETAQRLLDRGADTQENLLAGVTPLMLASRHRTPGSSSTIGRRRCGHRHCWQQRRRSVSVCVQQRSS